MISFNVSWWLSLHSLLKEEITKNSRNKLKEVHKSSDDAGVRGSAEVSYRDPPEES